MNARRKAPLAALVALGLLVATALWYFREAHDRPSTIPLPSPVENHAEAAKSEEARERVALAEPAKPAAVRPAEALLAQVRGRVVDERGQAIAASSVELREPSVRRTTTDAGGRFEFEAVRVFGPSCLLRVEAAGFPALELRDLRLQAGECDLGDLVLLRGASVSGRVVDSLGRVIDGALVSWRLRSRGTLQGGPRSSADGSFLLRNLPADCLLLAADKDGFRSDWSPPLTLAAGSSVGGIEIVLETALLIRGCVHDRATGEPVRASVRLLIPQRRRDLVVASGADGRFEAWGGLPSCTLLAKAYPLGEEASGRDELFELGPPGSSVPELSLYLERGAALDFLVLDAQSGAPIPAASLTWIGDLAPMPERLNPLLLARADPAARSDEAGRMHVEQDSLSWSGAVVAAAGYSPRALRLAVLTAPDAAVRLDRGGTLEVQLRSAGVPAVGAAVELACDCPDSYSEARHLPGTPRLVVARQETDSTGAAIFPLLAPGQYTLLARASGQAGVPQSGITIRSGETTRAVLELQPACSIRGRVTRGGVLCPWTEVVAQFGGRYTYTTRTDASGSFRLAGLAAGMYDLVAMSREQPGVQAGLRTCTLRSGEELEVEIVEDALLALTGSVQLNHRPAFGLLLRFERESDRRPYGSAPDECITDPAGRFELKLPAQTPGRLTVVHRSGSSVQVDLALLEHFSIDGTQAPLALDLETGSVEFEVLRTGTTELLQDFVQFVLRPDPAKGGVPGFAADFEWNIATNFGRRILPALPAGDYLMRMNTAKSADDADTDLSIRAGTTQVLQLYCDQRK